MELEKVTHIPNANMTEEDMKAIQDLDEMEINEINKTDATPQKTRKLANKIKNKKFRVYKRADATYIKRVENKNKEE